jgi:hypothetical protein
MMNKENLGEFGDKRILLSAGLLSTKVGIFGVKFKSHTLIFVDQFLFIF